MLGHRASTLLAQARCLNGLYSQVTHIMTWTVYTRRADYAEYEGTPLQRFLHKLAFLMRDRLSLLVYDSVEAFVGFLKRYDAPEVSSEEDGGECDDAGAVMQEKNFTCKICITFDEDKILTRNLN